MLLNKLQTKQLIHCPPWLPSTTHYLCQMGSIAYGVAGETSDIDIYGWCIPNKETIFPHLSGEIFGFGKQIKRFEQWQEHHIKDEDEGKEYDFAIYNIVKYIQLALENNPNILDSLFVPERCILHISQVGTILRENRKQFLHKGSYFKLKGYSYSQLHKMKIKQPQEGSKRAKDIKEHGFDQKFAYHIVRLLLEAEQILTQHDLNLECNSEILKSIRRGEWTEERIVEFFQSKEKMLDEVYHTSTLPYSPDEQAIKKILLQCLEHHFGSLEHAYIEPDRYKNTLLEIQNLCGKVL